LSENQKLYLRKMKV